MSWDDRQRAMLAEMGLRLPLPGRAAQLPASEGMPEEAALAEPEPIVIAAPPPAVLRVAAPAPAPATAAPTAVPIAAPIAAPPVRFDTLDLPALREAVSACRACGLCEQRRQAVFGGGALQQAQWLVVTDPPDEADDASGAVMSSEAGRLLDRMLGAAGQGRTGDAASAFVTPLVKCRPPRGRAPQPAELDACEAVLARQVALLQPRLILAMGLQAARRLTGPSSVSEPLGRLRGRVHSWQGLPVIVTYHPGYLLRSPADKAGAWDDLRLALQTGGPP